MKTVTIRDLRQRWPETEAALQIEEEILVTRDSKPVAKLVRVKESTRRRERWDPDEHRRWMKKVFGGGVIAGTDERLEAAREDRKLRKGR